MNIRIKQHVNDLAQTLSAIDTKKDQLVLDALKPRVGQVIASRYLVAVRIGAGLVLAFALANFRNYSGLVIAPLFLAGAVTYLLGQTDASANPDSVANALANRVLLLPVMFFALMSQNAYLFFLLMLLEIINGIVSLFAIDNHIALLRDIFAKSATTIQLAVFLAILALWPAQPALLFVLAIWLSLIFMIISITMKVITIRMHYEAKKSANLQHAFREKGTITTA